MTSNVRLGRGRGDKGGKNTQRACVHVQMDSKGCTPLYIPQKGKTLMQKTAQSHRNGKKRGGRQWNSLSFNFMFSLKVFTIYPQINLSLCEVGGAGWTKLAWEQVVRSQTENDVLQVWGCLICCCHHGVIAPPQPTTSGQCNKRALIVNLASAPMVNSEVFLWTQQSSTDKSWMWREVCFALGMRLAENDKEQVWLGPKMQHPAKLARCCQHVPKQVDQRVPPWGNASWFTIYICIVFFAFPCQSHSLQFLHLFYSCMFWFYAPLWLASSVSG